jgi:hypothetical protein
LKSPWVKDENGKEVFDDEIFWSNLAAHRAYVQDCVRQYVVAMEGTEEGKKTIEKLDL